MARLAFPWSHLPTKRLRSSKVAEHQMSRSEAGWINMTIEASYLGVKKRWSSREGAYGSLKSVSSGATSRIRDRLRMSDRREGYLGVGLRVEVEV